MKTIDSHPKKLGREPLLEVIFEFRFSAKISATNILPAVFLKPSNGSNENFKIDKLPSSEIPEFIRNQDPNLKYTPLLKIDRKDFNYFIENSLKCLNVESLKHHNLEYRASSLLIL